MPEIVVNGRFLSRRTTGMERYGREILSHIRGSYRLEKTRANGPAGHLWEQCILPGKLTASSVLWSPANTGPLDVSNQALTIHDLSPLEHPQWFRKSFASWYRLFLPTLARRVRVVFTPSEHVKQKVMKRFGIQTVMITPNGVNRAMFHPDASQCQYELPQRYILFVGSLQPRKNLSALLRSWEELQKEYSDLWLVIAGDTGSVYSKVELQTKERVRWLGYAAEEALPGLYAKATLFVLPSLDEGFGLPALEAMACGAPVVVSDGGALPEVVGEAAMVFPLAKPGSLSQAIRECLEDVDFCSSLAARGLEHATKFSWQRTAELIWNRLHEI